MNRSIAAFAAVSTIAMLACRTQERPRLPVDDETGDSEDCPGCVDPAYMLWNLQGAYSEGDLHAVGTTDGERPALLTVVLVDVEWWREQQGDEITDPYDHACTLTYTPSIGGPGDDAEAWFSWDLNLAPVEDGCGELDPDWIDQDFFEDLPGLGVDFSGAALDSVMESQLKTAFEGDGSGPDWETQGAPFYFGLTTTLDGRRVYESNQSHYGRAFAVELDGGDLFIRNEANGGTLLTTEQIAAGEPGWFEIFAWTFFEPHEYDL